MHRIFQNFVDSIASAPDSAALRDAMSEAAASLDLSCFAYLSMPDLPRSQPHLISTYPTTWTEHYLRRNYERLDPVIIQAIGETEPFAWGPEIGSSRLSNPQRELFEEAAKFGVRYGFTVPIHDSRGPVAAVTFAADERRPQFERCIGEHRRVLQLMAMYFHAHARRKLAPKRMIGGAVLSPREFECLEWVCQGKSAWEIGRILGISRRTAAFHLDNARAKLGVRSNYQAVALLVASKHTME
ncbi:DNA-binding transcriptional regulator, CsgD family [Rhizobiales bacterium GAS188]|nr:DNA-binding transcriptional regulator, CsgD family [Rhizobiales bacterium GAS188]